MIDYSTDRDLHCHALIGLNALWVWLLVVQRARGGRSDRSNDISFAPPELAGYIMHDHASIAIKSRIVYIKPVFLHIRSMNATVVSVVSGLFALHVISEFGFSAS